MRLKGIMILVAGAIVSAGIVEAGGEKKATLQGKWVAEKDGKKIELTFLKKGEFTIVMDTDKGKGTYKLNKKANPQEIDLSVVDGDGHIEKFKGKTSLGIIELKGDKLKWCAAEPGREKRPTEFADSQGDAKFLFVELTRSK